MTFHFFVLPRGTSRELRCGGGVGQRASSQRPATGQPSRMLEPEALGIAAIRWHKLGASAGAPPQWRSPAAAALPPLR